MKSQKLGLLLGANVIAACLVMQGCKAPKAVGPAPEAVTIREVEEKPVVVPAKPAPAPEPVVAPEPEVPATPIAEVKPLPPPPPPKEVAPVAKPEAPKAADTYVVRKGDTLSGISAKFNVRMSAIIALNPGVNPNKIRIGQKIKIPGGVVASDVKPVSSVSAAPKSVKVEAANTKAPATKPVAPYTGATKEYVVRSGDTLGGIAYDNGIKIRQLKEMNGLKSNNLRIGQKLKVPAEKQVASKKDSKKAEAKPAAKKADGVKAVESTKKVEKKEKAKPVEKKEDKAPAAAPVVEQQAPQPVESDVVVVAQAPAAAPTPVDSETSASASTMEYTVKEGEDIVSVAISCGVTPSALMDLNGLKAGDTLKPGQKLKLPASK